MDKMINKEMPFSNKKYEVLFLTNNQNTMELYNWLSDKCTIKLYDDPLSIDLIKKWNPDLVISYNYKYIIGQEVIDYMQGRIINLHISLLPWNRGSNPNIWSFIDSTPKGVTIHEISSKLDRGKIIYQQECVFDENVETFESSYCKLHQTMIGLFQRNWDNIKLGKYELQEQQGKGSYHNNKDLEKLKSICPFTWSDNISDYMKRYSESI